MHLSEDHAGGSYISKYDNDSITIGTQQYTENVLIAPNGEVTPWPIAQLQDLTEIECAALLQFEAEVIIIGTGAQHQLPQAGLLQYFLKHHRGVEVMSTAAACRTYNILLAENRLVVAALMLS